VSRTAGGDDASVDTMIDVSERSDDPTRPAPCCTAPRGGAGAHRPSGSTSVDGEPRRSPPTPPDGRDRRDDTVRVPAGTFTIGTDRPLLPQDGEGPARRVRLPAFRIDRYAVSNARFAAFVAATGHRTDAERYGWSFVFHAFVPQAVGATRGVPGAPWWRQVHDATWWTPEGPGSDVRNRWDHPVVHVSWNDAVAFASWTEGRLPTEAEWEVAARGGSEGTIFPWGDELEPGGEHRCNVWQGAFPHLDAGADGYRGTAPVDAFAPNGYGLHGVIGNVWEWCADRFGVDHEPGLQHAPRGPATGARRVMKGGSYLCHASYCTRYRLAARTSGAEDDGPGNVGFRVAYDG